MKKYIVLLLLLFLAGCATVQIAEIPEVWKVSGAYGFIEAYVGDYGEPHLVVHGMNNLTGDEYLDLYWQINGYWYKVQIYKDADGWSLLEDQIASSRM